MSFRGKAQHIKKHKQKKMSFRGKVQPKESIYHLPVQLLLPRLSCYCSFLNLSTQETCKSKNAKKMKKKQCNLCLQNVLPKFPEALIWEGKIDFKKRWLDGSRLDGWSWNKSRNWKRKQKCQKMKKTMQSLTSKCPAKISRSSHMGRKDWFQKKMAWWLKAWWLVMKQERKYEKESKNANKRRKKQCNLWLQNALPKFPEALIWEGKIDFKKGGLMAQGLMACTSGHWKITPTPLSKVKNLMKWP